MNPFWISLLAFYIVSLFYLYSFTFNFSFFQPGSLAAEILIVFTPLVSGIYFLAHSIRLAIRKRSPSFIFFNNLSYFLGFLLLYLSAVITSTFEKGYLLNVGVALVFISTIFFSVYSLVRVLVLAHRHLHTILKLKPLVSLFLLSFLLIFQLAVVFLFIVTRLVPEV